MACDGILRFSVEIPYTLTGNRNIDRREVVTCRLNFGVCPKSRGKCIITERCWRFKNEY